MSDAVLTQLNALVSGMNAFYIMIPLLALSLIFFFLMIFRDEMWWRGFMMFIAGVFFQIAVIFGLAKEIIPKSFALIGWIGYAIIIIGGTLTIVGLIYEIINLGVS